MQIIDGLRYDLDSAKNYSQEQAKERDQLDRLQRNHDRLQEELKRAVEMTESTQTDNTRLRDQVNQLHQIQRRDIRAEQQDRDKGGSDPRMFGWSQLPKSAYEFTPPNADAFRATAQEDRGVNGQRENPSYENRSQRVGNGNLPQASELMPNQLPERNTSFKQSFHGPARAQS